MKNAIYIGLILDFLGLLDSLYLTIVHFKNIVPPCSIALGCETVLASKYAMFGPIPISLLGSIYYVIIMVMLWILLQNKDNLRLKIFNLGILKSLLLIITTIGLVVSVILIYIQAFTLHAFCQYCLASEGINVLLFLLMVKLNFTSQQWNF